MKITLDIKDLDYGSLIAALLPTIHDRIANEESSFVNKIILKLTSLSPSTVQKMVNLLPKETQDEIVIMLIQKNKDKILELIGNLARENHVSFRVEDFRVENS